MQQSVEKKELTLHSRWPRRGRQRGQVKIQAEHSTKQELHLQVEDAQAILLQAREDQLQQHRAAEACILHDLRLLEELAGLQQLSTLMLQGQAVLYKRRLEVKQEIEEPGQYVSTLCLSQLEHVAVDELVFVGLAS